MNRNFNNSERKELEVKLTDRLLNNIYQSAHQKDEEEDICVDLRGQSDEEMVKMNKISNGILQSSKLQDDGALYFTNELEELYNSLENEEENDEDDVKVSLPRFTGEEDEEDFEVAPGYKDDDFEEYNM